MIHYLDIFYASIQRGLVVYASHFMTSKLFHVNFLLKSWNFRQEGGKTQKLEYLENQKSV